MRKGITLSWLNSDHLGSASMATDTSGNTVANSAQRFTPFGSPRLNASGLDSKFTFTSQRSFMEEIWTMDYGARQYSPLLGRFLSADSIVPGAGDPQNFNRYSYVNNRPLNLVDPTGHCAGDPSNRDSKDQACWDEYDKVQSHFGYDPDELVQMGIIRVSWTCRLDFCWGIVYCRAIESRSMECK